MIFADELAFIPMKTVFKVIMPLLTVENRALLCSTTPNGMDNWVTAACDMKDENGQPMFEVVLLQLMCARCRDRGVRGACVHNMHLIPGFKSDEKIRRIEAMIGGDKETIAEELYGVASSSSRGAFDPSKIQTFVSKPPVDWIAPPESPLFMVLDPTGGGSSNMAIISGFVTQGRIVVRGLACVRARGGVCPSVCLRCIQGGAPPW